MYTGELDAHPKQSSAQPPPTASMRPWYAWLLSPLWLCLLLALGIRIWLVIYTQGFIDGDEALVGIQAQHILHGELPAYYYGQPYMGSLEAYLIALLFAIFGSSTWVMRAEPILLSLVLVWLTWCLAHALTDEVHLSLAARRWFTAIATLFAALPPLYDGILELRAWGGHIETYVLILWLLLATLRLTQRWQAGFGERILRWIGIGLLVGLGLWVYPLIIIAIFAAVLWILGFCVTEVIHRRRTSFQLSAAVTPTLQRLMLALVTLPAILIGFFPALLWGASHGWANILYLLSPANEGSRNLHLQQLYPNRFALLRGTILLYAKCAAPHVIGGALPDSHIRFALLQASVGVLVILATMGLLLLSFFRPCPLLKSLRKLTFFPAIFGAVSALVFCSSSISSAGLLFPCVRDEVGRYAAPLALVLPFFFAGITTLIFIFLAGLSERSIHADASCPSVDVPIVAVRRRWSHPLQAVLPAFLALYLVGQGLSYLNTNADYAFQSFACTIAPVNDEPIIAYMWREHIKYAWGTVWIGNAINFKTQGAIAVVDPRIIAVNAVNRLPANTAAIRRATRPAVLAFALHSDLHPALLRALDALGVTYKMARFPAEQGHDVLIVIPDRTLSPLAADALGSWPFGC